MGMKKWLFDNVMWILVGLLALTFVIMYWSTVNFWVYGGRSSVFKWDMFRPKKTALQEQVQTAEADGLTGTAVPSDAVASENLIRTCSDDDLGSAFASIRPAVVNITADKVTSRRGGPSTVSTVTFDDPAIRFVEEQSLGSGFIVDSRGFVVTNAHVATKSTELKVVTFGFERVAYDAIVVRKDMENDIAILKINADGPLPTAILGDSDMVQVAQTVMAIGAPFGLEQTVTAGIISDDSRSLVIDGQVYEDMLQTDAAINRGNSGGPLVSTNGEVIGITTAIYAPTGVFAGVGFAIPINKVKSLVKETLTNE